MRFRLIIQSLVILVSLIAIMSNFVLLQLKRCWRSWTFLLKEYETGITIYFYGVFQCYRFPQCHNIWMNKFFQPIIIIFRGSIVKLILSSRFEVFNDNELLWSLSPSIYWVVLLSVFVQQTRKFLLLGKELKGKIVLKYSMQYQD